MTFENKVVNGIYYSRIIASYLNAGGTLNGKNRWKFKEWLHSLFLDQEVEDEIYLLATNGKLELEEHAKKWLSRQS